MAALEDAPHVAEFMAERYFPALRRDAGAAGAEHIYIYIYIYIHTYIHMLTISIHTNCAYVLLDQLGGRARRVRPPGRERSPGHAAPPGRLPEVQQSYHFIVCYIVIFHCKNKHIN